MQGGLSPPCNPRRRNLRRRFRLLCVNSATFGKSATFAFILACHKKIGRNPENDSHGSEEFVPECFLACTQQVQPRGQSGGPQHGTQPPPDLVHIQVEVYLPPHLHQPLHPGYSAHFLNQFLLGFPIAISLRAIARNCTQLFSNCAQLHGIAQF